MRIGVRREMDLVVKEKRIEGKFTFWSFADHKDRKFVWKTQTDRNLEIGRGYILKAKVVMEIGLGWKLSNPYFV